MTQAAIDIIVDPEFRQLIPPLTPDERAQLEANLLADGCRDALVVWAGENILLDGHNRLDICQAHGIEFDVYELELADRDAAKNWIDTNQLGRRNLTPDFISLLRGRIYERTKQAHGGAREAKPQNEVLTSEKLAERFGVSRATIERDAQFARAVAPSLTVGEFIAGKTIDELHRILDVGDLLHHQERELYALARQELARREAATEKKTSRPLF